MVTYLLSAILAVGALNPAAQVVENQKQALRGIDAFHVVVQVANGLQGGIPQSTLQTAIELKLRQNGIRVVGMEAPDAPILLMIIDATAEIRPGQVLFLAHMKVLQAVRPFASSDGSSSLVAVVWEKISYGTTDIKRPDEAKTAFNDSVDSFLNDYLAVNPKK